MSDLISIIVPIYNASKYLSQCIESILVQTYKKLEIILIDDGSTDDSARICENYKKRDERIRIIYQKNGGLVSARKTGLNMASGDYIGFVDADDYIERDMFEELYLKIKEFDVDFVHSGMITDNEKICNYHEGVVDLTSLDRAEYVSKNVFRRQQIFFALWSKLFKADLVRDAYMQLPDEQSYGEDLLCLCNYVLKCNRFYICRKAFYHYRVYKGSMSHLNWLDTCFEESKLYRQIITFLKKNDLLEKCGDSVKYHYRKCIINSIRQDSSSGMNVLTYRYNSIENLKNKNVVIYGAGNVGKDFYKQIFHYNQCEIVAWIDKEKCGVLNLITIEKPEALKNIKYDVILLAVKSKTVADEIKKELIQNGICKRNVAFLWEEPVYIFQE